MEKNKIHTFYHVLNPDYILTGQLVAKYEVNLSSLHCDYYPGDISDEELFELWVERARKIYSSGQIDIFWMVQLIGMDFKTETMPFQEHFLGGDNFLSFFSYPTDVETGEPINWLTLPVQTPRWDSEYQDKGGFIEALTGWKPGILQPTVSIEALIQAARAKKHQNKC